MFCFLSSWSIVVTVDGPASSPYPLSSGVPQGSVPSPILFLLSINDLLSTNHPVHSYEVDPTLCSSASFKYHVSSSPHSFSDYTSTTLVISDLNNIFPCVKRNLVKVYAS